MIEDNLWNFDYEGHQRGGRLICELPAQKIDTAATKLIQTVWGTGWVKEEN